MTKTEPKTATEISISAVLIGEAKIEHIIRIPLSMEKDYHLLGVEFLKRQYPIRYREMVDITVDVVKETH